MTKKEKAQRGQVYMKWVRAYIECLKDDRDVSMLTIEQQLKNLERAELIGRQMNLGF